MSLNSLQLVSQKKPPSTFITFLLALSCGMLVANIYYSQPLLALIAATLHIPSQLAGFVAMLTQLGYGLGLILVVPLGDIFENRKLILLLIILSILSLISVALAPTITLFLVATFCTGLGSVAVQILVPYAAHLSDEANRGKAVGNVMAGLMVGIMLARPIASIIARYFMWQGVFILAALALFVLGIVLRMKLPKRTPSTPIKYKSLMTSIVHLARSVPILRRRAFYQAAMFGSFSLFWTVTPLLLASPAIGLTQGGIALFALVGAASVIASPIAGRLADKSWVRPVTGLALLGGVTTFLICIMLPSEPHIKIIVLTIAALLLDFSVTTNLVLGQREIFLLDGSIRARLNGIYMATFFMGGALGSSLGVWVYTSGGWVMASLVGLTPPFLAFIYYLTEKPQV